MLTVNRLREDSQKIKEAYLKRGLKEGSMAMIDEIIALDDRRKSIQTELDESLAKGKLLSKFIFLTYLF